MNITLSPAICTGKQDVFNNAIVRGSNSQIDEQGNVLYLNYLTEILI